MSENVTKTGFDVLVDLDLSKVKSKLRPKIIKQIMKDNLQVTINVDVYGAEEGSIDIVTDAVVTVKRKKRKNKK